MDSKCRNCDKRQVGCHAKCEDYKKWTKWHKEQTKLVARGNRKQRDYFYTTKGDTKAL